MAKIRFRNGKPLDAEGDMVRWSKADEWCSDIDCPCDDGDDIDCKWFKKDGTLRSKWQNHPANTKVKKERVKMSGQLIDEKYILDLVPKYKMTFWEAVKQFWPEIAEKIKSHNGPNMRIVRDGATLGQPRGGAQGLVYATDCFKYPHGNISAAGVAFENSQYGYYVPFDDIEGAEIVLASFEPVVQALEYLTKEPIPRLAGAEKGKKKFPNFETVTLPKDILDSVKETITTTKQEKYDKVFKLWGLGQRLEKGAGCHMLFYGPPGTGKTLLAEAIANELGRELKLVGSAEIQSSEPGGAERAIKSFFKDAAQNKKVLCFDECDSLIYDRRRIGMILAAEVNCLLGEMERFNGVAVYTTNNTPCLDTAFERRLSLKVKFPMPDKELRLKIWKGFFPVPQALAQCVDLEFLAKFVLTGGIIKNVVLAAAKRAAYLDREQILHEDFLFALEREKTGHEAFKNRVEDEELQQEMGMEMVGGELQKVKTMQKEAQNE